MTEKPKKEISEKQVLELIELVSAPKAGGVIKKGVNEVTKAIERGVAKLVVAAKDVNPPAVIAHLPELCRTKDKPVPLIMVSGRKELGVAAGVQVPCSAIAVIEPGSDAAKALLMKITES